MFNFIITHKLQEFVTTLAMYLSSEKAQNPARKHFEKANNCILSISQLAAGDMVLVEA